MKNTIEYLTVVLAYENWILRRACCGTDSRLQRIRVAERGIQMEFKRYRVLRLAFTLLSMVIMGAVLWGQEAKSSSADVALVTDWSHRHLIYSAPNAVEVPARWLEEPRYWQQSLRLNRARRSDPDEGRDDAGRDRDGKRFVRHKNPFKRDWAVSLGPGATVGAGRYPAKYSFGSSTANCGNATHPDFVAFNTSVAGSATQASIVAFDNLYSGCATGTVPSTYWAYNTGGTVQTSSVLSLDGTQLAFVQTVSSQAQLVLLKWAAGSGVTSTSPGPITVVSASQYPICTAPCMTTIAFTGGANDTNSSPFEDYTDDTIYVGDDAGALHKFTPVFRGGTPAEVTTGWPVTLASGLKLASPVFDHPTRRVFVGSGYSVSGTQLFAVNGATGAVVGTGSSLGKGVGIAAGIVVDSTAAKAYVFVGNDGGTGCGGPCSAVYQFATNFTSGSGTKATVGVSGSFTLYNGDFDNTYFTSANGTGNLIVCGGGLGTAEPTIWRVPITAGVMSTSSVFGPALSLSNVPCSPVTDVYNPQSGGADRIFAGVTTGSDAAACSSGGCVVNLVSNVWQPSTSYTVGQVVLDPGNFMQVVAVAGTSKTGSAPSWIDTCSNETTDGTITWTNAGFLTPVTPQPWTANTFWSVGSRILDSNGNIECNLETGIHSGVTAPTWNTSIGGLTTEITGLQWRNGGKMTSHALPTAGGTSGIIMDNVVGTGVIAGASQVYFSTLGTGGCGAGNGCAVQASQSNLN